MSPAKDSTTEAGVEARTVAPTSTRTAEITLAYWWTDDQGRQHVPGDKVTVPVETAITLYQAGAVDLGSKDPAKALADWRG